MTDSWNDWYDHKTMGPGSAIKHFTFASFLMLLSLSRSEWWKFIPTALVLLFQSRERMRALIRTPSAKDLGIGIVIWIGVYFLHRSMRLIVSLEKIVLFYPLNLHDSVLRGIGIAAQTISEDILLRFKLRDWVIRFIRPRYTPLFFGLIFSSMHFLLYFFGQEHTILNILAVTTLFLFGYYSEIFLRKGNSVLWVFLLHFLWNREKYSVTYSLYYTKIELKEAETFNLIEGSVVSFLAILICGWVMSYCFKKHANK